MDRNPTRRKVLVGAAAVAAWITLPPPGNPDDVDAFRNGHCRVCIWCQRFSVRRRTRRDAAPTTAAAPCARADVDQLACRLPLKQLDELQQLSPAGHSCEAEVIQGPL